MENSQFRALGGSWWEHQQLAANLEVSGDPPAV